MNMVAAEAPIMPHPTVAFKAILGSRVFLIVTASTGLAYFGFFRYLDLVAGVPMAATSYLVLLYVLISVSSVLMGLNVFHSARSYWPTRWLCPRLRRAHRAPSMALFAGTISCFCHTSLLPFLGSVAISGISVIAALAEYQSWILFAFIMVNLYLVYSTLQRILIVNN